MSQQFLYQPVIEEPEMTVQEVIAKMERQNTLKEEIYKQYEKKDLPKKEYQQQMLLMNFVTTYQDLFNLSPLSIPVTAKIDDILDRLNERCGESCFKINVHRFDEETLPYKLKNNNFCQSNDNLYKCKTAFTDKFFSIDEEELQKKDTHFDLLQYYDKKITTRFQKLNLDGSLDLAVNFILPTPPPPPTSLPPAPVKPYVSKEMKEVKEKIKKISKEPIIPFQVMERTFTVKVSPKSMRFLKILGEYAIAQAEDKRMARTPKFPHPTKKAFDAIGFCQKACENEDINKNNLDICAEPESKKGVPETPSTIPFIHAEKEAFPNCRKYSNVNDIEKILDLYQVKLYEEIDEYKDFTPIFKCKKDACKITNVDLFYDYFTDEYISKLPTP